MRIPPTGYLALPCAELVRVIVWAHTGIVVGIAAGIGSVVAAMCWEV
jgi:hypothetical protein